MGYIIIGVIVFVINFSIFLKCFNGFCLCLAMSDLVQDFETVRICALLKASSIWK